MEQNQVSLTALLTAFARAYHSIHDSPKIFNDYLAEKVLTEEEQAFLGQSLATALTFFNPEIAASNPDQDTALDWVIKEQNGPITLSRSQYTENTLELAVEHQGVEQYIILGAGLDTFTFRQPGLMNRLHVFEVDHPATQNFKKNRLAQLGWEIPDGLHFVPVDLTKDSLTEALKQSSYNPEKISFFSWLGVTYYLDKTVVLNTLRTIADVAPAGSSIVFDYIDVEGFNPERASNRMKKMQTIVAQAGEPMKANLEASSLKAELEKIDLQLKENLGPIDIEERFFQGRTDGYHAFEHVYFAMAVMQGY